MKENYYNDDDRQYLQMLQGNIERMASNSANCKTWMVTIVAAFLALQCSIDELNGWILLAIIPAILFWYLDTYYLHLERGMRNRENSFIDILKRDDAEAHKKAMYIFSPMMISKEELTEDQKNAGLVATDDRWFTKSTAPFYCITIVIILTICLVLNWSTIFG